MSWIGSPSLSVAASVLVCWMSWVVGVSAAENQEVGAGSEALPAGDDPSKAADTPTPEARDTSAKPAASRKPPTRKGQLRELEAERRRADADPRALTDFRSVLDRYGTWIQHPAYGLVWVPHRHQVGPDFAPYVTSGRWAMNHAGEWVWVSRYPFGPIVFHYGRWVWATPTGWVWVPGRRFAPAWVVWRVSASSGGYVGWGPMPPSWVWFNGVPVAVGYVPVPYVFCPSAYVFHHYPYTFLVRNRVLVRRLGRRTRRYVPRPAGRWGPTMAQAAIPRRAWPSKRIGLARFSLGILRTRQSSRHVRSAGPSRASGVRPGRGSWLGVQSPHGRARRRQRSVIPMDKVQRGRRVLPSNSARTPWSPPNHGRSHRTPWPSGAPRRR
jgi:hypothetical protein